MSRQGVSSSALRLVLALHLSSKAISRSRFSTVASAGCTWRRWSPPSCTAQHWYPLWVSRQCSGFPGLVITCRRKRSSWIPLSSSCFWWHHQGTSGTGWGILELNWRLVAVLGFCGLSWRRTWSGAHPGGCWLCKALAAAGPISTPGSLEN